MAKLMDRAKILLRKFMEPNKFREIGGTLTLATATGEMEIPVDFVIANVEFDSFAVGADPSCDFVAPCAPIPNEFIKCDFINDDSLPHNYVKISWAINSYRLLNWKAMGFTK